MAQIRIACLVGKTNKAGVTSWYWQPSATLAKAGWKALTLGKDEGAAIAAARKRNEEVEIWKVGGDRPEQIRQRILTGTVGALVERYRREVLQGMKPDGRTRRIKPKTAEAYETGLKRIELWAGKQPLAYITPARVRVLRDQTAKPPAQGGIGHSAAFNLLKTLRQVMAFAESVDLIPKGSNPAADFNLAAPPPRRATWSPEHEAAFIAAAYDLGRPSMVLALELAIYTAQREADLLAFTEPQYCELSILDPVVRQRFADDQGRVMGWDFDQEKTSDEYVSVEMAIPFEATLRAKVEDAIRRNRARDRAAEPTRLLSYVLVDDNTGLPWKKRHFIRTWTKILDHAAEKANRPEMRELVWHDLRRTRVVRLRRMGMDPAMISTITGHSLQSINMMLKVYGPVDRQMTAAALAATLPALEAPANDEKEQSA